MKTNKYTKKLIIVVASALLLLSVSVPAALASGGSYHKVKYGENLYRIGLHYGVNYHQLAKANGIHNPHHIYAGQVIYIPPAKTYNNHYNNHYNNNHYGSNYHKVQYGENLSSIAYRYGVSPWALAKANNIYNLNHIYAGQYLHIPSGY